ncbi:MAG: ABC transporter substrate-binding protein [Bernardetiaceae bacterium]|nr:ABC transporter substrate-binding protein [Bernardetiaceae bacterium]
MKKNYYLLCFIFLLSACGQRSDSPGTVYVPENEQELIAQEDSLLQTIEPLVLDYAKGFSVRYEKGAKIVSVSDKPFVYVLYPKGSTAPKLALEHEALFVEVPIERAVLRSTKYAPFFSLLGENDKIVGFAAGKYLSDKVLYERYEKGEIQELGKANDGSLDIEKTLKINTDFILTDYVGTMPEADNKLHSLTLPIIRAAETLEATPLGQAEWIKFVALFLNKEKQATVIFNDIKAQYESTAKAAQEATATTKKPTVLLNMPYKDTWYMPGGKSFMASYMADAGADYLWKNTGARQALALSLEWVFKKGTEADFWLHTDYFQSLEELKKNHERYASFKAVKKGNVFNFSKRRNPHGGYDIFEQGVARPDKVLADLFHIFHPEASPAHELYFYEKLE